MLEINDVVFCIVSYRIVSYRIVSYRIVSCRVVSCRVVSCRVVSCRVVSYRIVSYKHLTIGVRQDKINDKYFPRLTKCCCIIFSIIKFSMFSRAVVAPHFKAAWSNASSYVRSVTCYTLTGCPDTLFDSVHKTIFTLPDETLVFPAHDYKGV